MKRVQCIWLAALVLTICAATRTSLARSDPFDGKWIINIDPDDDARKTGEKTVEDTLTFTGGKLSAEWCKKHGFAPAAYEEDTRRFGPAAFSAELTSDKEGKAKWTGTITGGNIAGDIVWVGTPEDVAGKIAPLVELGYRHLIAGVPSPYDEESMTRFATEVRPMLERISS